MKRSFWKLLIRNFVRTSCFIVLLILALELIRFITGLPGWSVAAAFVVGLIVLEAIDEYKKQETS